MRQDLSESAVFECENTVANYGQLNIDSLNCPSNEAFVHDVLDNYRLHLFVVAR